MIRHVYVHIPFCTHICPYCAFYKTRNLTADMNGFLPALAREMEDACEHFTIQPRTVFFGGGTPSALSLGQFKELLSFWPWTGVEEFTLEANPMTISPAKARLLCDLGVNRISLGVQAFDGPTLKKLGRTHSSEEVKRSFQRLRDSGFENINIDLMFAVPGQSPDAFMAGLEEALALEPDHFSLYELTYEEDTEFLERLEAGELSIETTGEEIHRRAIERLADAGFRHYEVSNFARPGREARHNQACWRGEDYIGFGPSATSTVEKRRWKNVADISRYKQNPLERIPDELDEAARHRERVFLGLRTDQGIPADWVSGRDGFLNQLSNEGLLHERENRIVLSSRGLMLADAIAGELI